MARPVVWTPPRLASLLAECREPGISNAEVGRRHGISRQYVSELKDKAERQEADRLGLPFTARDMADMFGVDFSAIEAALRTVSPVPVLKVA